VDLFSAAQVTGNSISNSVDVIHRTLFENESQTPPGLDDMVTYNTQSLRTFQNQEVQGVLKGSSLDPMPHQQAGSPFTISARVSCAASAS
jgi:hypothetical protein